MSVILPPSARKLLKAMNNVKCESVEFVYIDIATMRAYPTKGYYAKDIEQSLNSDKYVNIRTKREYLYDTLTYLEENKLIEHSNVSVPLYKITYIGWNHSYLRFVEIVKAVTTHVLFPALVAFITTIITLFFTR